MFADNTAASDNKPNDKVAEAPVESVPPAAVERIPVSSILYIDALSLEPVVTRPRRVSVSEPAEPPASGDTATTPTPATSVPRRSPGVSTAPMSVGEKFMLFATKSFKPVGPYAFSAFTGTFNELIDNDHGKDQDTGDFFADAGTRAARSYAFRVTANFFEKFVYPVAFRQDPRYHRSGKTGAGGKIGYAVSRLFVTQGDRGGDQFNASFIVGGLTTAAMSNVWEREERRNVSSSAKRFGIHLGLTALTNIVREFIGGQ
jgi:hypothetical protein